MIGKSLGPYKIIELLGAGGMGEVYLGEDTRLGRKVAIKVLPAEFASDPERLARFEQEARAAAALNHPHIAVVHDVGAEPGDDGATTHFIVQEYLEGQSLRERLEKGALPLDKALDLATEVGEALIAAHKAGIIHRDLKPDNIFVTEEGHAKVLDFGLAKLTEMGAPTGSSASMSPTMLGTVAGQVMGTAGYMAPEQINGEDVDQRADLFAFGCVLYGMVTGRQAFSGKNVHETLGRILSDEPVPMADIDKAAPTELQRIVRKALAKEAARRYQTAGDLNIDLRQLQDDIAAGVATPSGAHQVPVAATPVPQAGGGTWVTTAGVGVATALAAALAVWETMRAEPTAPEALKRFRIELPAGVSFPMDGNQLALSPDGNTLVFLGAEGGEWRLFLQRLDQLLAAPMPGTEGAKKPFFSPDGEWVAFNADGNLQRVAVAGGEPFNLCEGCAARGSSGAWGPLGTIVFANGNSFWEIPEGGGTPAFIAEPDPDRDETQYLRPEFLPDGKAILFELRRGGAVADADIAVLDLETKEVTILAEQGTDPLYAQSGHVLYARGDSLFSVAFDADELRPIG